MEDTNSLKPISTLAHKRKPISRSSSSSTKRKPKKQNRETVRCDQNDDDDDVDGEDEREEVERRIEALQRIVPGGESLGVDKLFEETAGYIMALQRQLKAMKTLANLIQEIEKQETNFRG